MIKSALETGALKFMYFQDGVKSALETGALKFLYFKDNIANAGKTISSKLNTLKTQMQTLGKKTVELGAKLAGKLVSGLKTAGKATLTFSAKLAKLSAKAIITGARLALLGIKAVALGAKMVITAIFTGMQTVATWALNSALLANPITWIIAAIIALGVAIVVLWNKCQTFRTIVKLLWNLLVSVGTWIFGVFISAWWMLSSAVSGVFSSIWGTVSGWAGSIIGFFSGLGSTLYNSGVAIIQGLWNGMKAVWNRVVGWISNGLKKIRNLFPFSPAKEGPFSGKGWVYYSGVSIGEAFATGIVHSTGNAVTATKRLANEVKGRLAGGNVGNYLFSPQTGQNLQAGKRETNITVNTQSTSTAEQIAREILWKIPQY